MKEGFKGYGSSLDDIRKPGDKCSKGPKMAKKADGGFKGKGGGGQHWPGQAPSLPKK